MCRKYFSTDNLYDVLKLPQNSSQSKSKNGSSVEKKLLRRSFAIVFFYFNRISSDSVVKKAYHTESLLFHPDKLGSADSTEKCKVLNLVYSILMDENRKKIYDERGIIMSENDFILSDVEMERAIQKYAGKATNSVFLSIS